MSILAGMGGEGRWSHGKERRRYFSATESADIWGRWHRGEGLKLIGRVFGKSSSSIFAHLCPHGDIRPVPRRVRAGH
jgi:IS30 family transposase